MLLPVTFLRQSRHALSAPGGTHPEGQNKLRGIPFMYEAASLLVAFVGLSHIVIYAPEDLQTCRLDATPII
ncbi:MAG TPA: hypothetical protein DHV72_02385 [Serratia grimesii]|uniref:Uncharacterized protein n=1 Tax=Serratia grimesii TaxID=82995 RepID=A0A9C7V4Y1_9GAMM|nr:hypothetical protein [Serratia grimesii]